VPERIFFVLRDVVVENPVRAVEVEIVEVLKRIVNGIWRDKHRG
jgi:hypothetical protein